MNQNKIAFIERHKSLFWSVSPQKRSEISDILLVETILNYGSWEDVQSLLDVLGLEKTANIFFNAVENRQRNNYLPIVKNYFDLYFKKRLSKLKEINERI